MNLWYTVINNILWSLNICGTCGGAPLSFWVLVIWVFSLPWPERLEDYSVYWSSNSQLWVLWVLLSFFCFVSFISSLIFIISTLLLTLVLIWSSFFSFFRWKLRSEISDLLPFLMQIHHTTNLHLSTTLIAFHKFWNVVFSLSFS